MLSAVAYALYLFVLVFAPLALGAVDLWAQATLQGVAFLALLFFILDRLRSGDPVYKVPGLFFAAGFLVLGILQLIPLPTGLIDLLSPQTLSLYRDGLGAQHLPAAIPLSINPEQTLGELFRFATNIAVYILTIQLLSDPKRQQQALHVVLLLGCVVAVQAILYNFSGNDKLLWVQAVHKPGLICGPFTYKNQFAGFMEMLLPVALAMFFYFQPRTQYKQSVRRQLAEIFNQEGTNRYLLYGFVCVLIVSSLALSRSRGGMICTLLGLLIFFLWCRRRFHLSLTMPYLLALLLVAGVGIGQVGWNTMDERFGAVVNAEGTQLSETGRTLSGRTTFWKDSLPIVKDFPFFGTGIGTFSSIYPGYRGRPQSFYLGSAHNDYLELFTDGGLIAAALVLGFLFTVFRTTLLVFARRRDRYQGYLYIGSMSGVIALLIHCCAEYHFNNSWIVGISFFFWLGITVVTSHSRRHGGRPSLLPKQATTSWSKGLVLLPTLLVFVSGLVFYIGELRAQSHTPRLIRISRSMSAEEQGELVKNASTSTRLAPFNSRYFSILALAADNAGQDSTARSAYLRAIQLDPADAFYQQQYAYFLTMHGKLENAEHHLQVALRRNRFKPEQYKAVAYWYLGRRQWQEAGALLQQFFLLEPSVQLLKNELQTMSSMGMPEDIMKDYLPRQTKVLLAYGQFLHKKGQQDAAEQAFSQALALAENEEEPQPWYFLTPYSFYRQIKLDDKAFIAARLGVQKLPANFRLRVALGDILVKEGLLRKAEEEYRQALMLRPGDGKVKKRLEALNLQQ